VWHRSALARAVGLAVSAVTVYVVVQFAGNIGHRQGYPVHHDQRTWYYASRTTADDVRRVLAFADHRSQGDTSVFVGTADLSQTPYVDDSLYFLLPRLTERSHFYDFHPGIALHDGRRLAADVLASRILILTRITIDESNLSSRHGSQLANQVVARRFSLVGRVGSYSIYQRRNAASARGGTG
jgi:hypothetical protein